MESLGLMYRRVSTMNSLCLPVDLMDHYQCAFRHFMELFQDNYVNFI